MADIITITPDMAKQYLEMNTSNRPLSFGHVQNLARMMKEGLWVFNGDSICFDKEGVLIDGQHRLMACVRSNVPFKAVIVKGLPKEAFDTKDQHIKKRNYSDILALRGTEYWSHMAAVIKKQSDYDYYLAHGSLRSPDKKVSRQALTTQELDATHKRHPNIGAATRIQTRKMGKNMMTPSLLAFVHYNASRYDSVKADYFLEKFVSGEDLKKGSPIKTAREWALQQVNSIVRASTAQKIKVMTYAWNKFVAGETWSSIRMPQSSGIFILFKGDKYEK